MRWYSVISGIPWIYKGGVVVGLADIFYIIPLEFITGKSMHWREDSVVPYQSLLFTASCYIQVIGRPGSFLGCRS